MRRLPFAVLAAAAVAWCACSETGTSQRVDTSDSLAADTPRAVLTVDTTLLADLPLNEVSGAVSEIVTINDYGSDTLRFDTAGFIISEILEAQGLVEGHPSWQPFACRGVSESDDPEMKVVRDGRGLMQSWNLDDKVKYTFTWDGDRLVAFTSEITGDEGTRTEKGEYTYDAQGHAITYHGVVAYNSAKGHEFEEKYSDYKFDDRGNWISRKVSQHSNTYTVTRQIKYYEGQ